MTVRYITHNGTDTYANASNFATPMSLASAVAGATAGDELRICNTGTYTLSSALALTADGSAGSGRIIWQGANSSGTVDGTKPLITSATNSVNLWELNAADYHLFRTIKLTHTAGTRAAAFAGVTASSTNIGFEDIEVDGCSYFVQANSREFNFFSAERCLIKNCTTGGITNAATVQVLSFNRFLSNTGNAWDSAGATVANGQFLFNTFYANGRGIYDTGTSRSMVLTVVGNLFHSQVDDGFRSDETTGSITLIHFGNVYWSNGGASDYGINLQDGQTETVARMLANLYNAYGDNGNTGLLNRNNLPAGTGDITLTADPCENAASGDFNWNATSGGGADVKAVVLTLDSTTVYPFGTLTVPGGGGGGTNVFLPPGSGRFGVRES